MTIRPWVEADIPAVAALGVSFIEQTQYPTLVGAVDQEKLEALLTTLWEMGPQQATCFVAEDGDRLIGGLLLGLFLHPLSFEVEAHEVGWWVEPGARHRMVGPRLLRCAENWVAQVGVKWFKMVAPEGTRVGEFYRRLGYRPVETIYVKVPRRAHGPLLVAPAADADGPRAATRAGHQPDPSDA
jgi:GNAT superfamily N-acetyltransferase